MLILLGGCISTESVHVDVTRLNSGQPIIDGAFGGNINGPSVIRVPDWISPASRPDPQAIYYMYFASHIGTHIRMAWAQDIQGPWHIYNNGGGVLALDRNTRIGNGILLKGHVASPDVTVDNANKSIVMYFHAPATVDGVDVGQKTFAASSDDGLDFNGRIRPVIIGSSYFRVFQNNGSTYAVSRGGQLHKAPAGLGFPESLWATRQDNPFQTSLDAAGLSNVTLRHAAVIAAGSTLYVFYSRIGDSPERILMSTMDLSTGDYNNWTLTHPPVEILRAEMPWEGSDIAPQKSTEGSAPEHVNQLRDPYIFKDSDGKTYLFYCGAGEEAIGVAEIHIKKKLL
ncbi:MAG: hypothetical protein V1875_04855 [Candidatus Altiarchaeota archaeon]